MMYFNVIKVFYSYYASFMIHSTCIIFLAADGAAKMRVQVHEFRMLLIAGLALLLGGCASTVGHHKVEDLHNIPLGTVPARTYEASGEEVKQAALYSLKKTGLENIQEHQMGDAAWYITGEIGYSWRSNGQFVRIAASVDRTSNPLRTKVFYTSLRRFEINVTEDLSVIRDKLLDLMDNFIESQ
jgi:hypothetical protein